MGVHHMSQVSHVGATASARSSRRRKDAGKHEEGERFTPLLTRDAHTFSRMRTDQGAPRMFSTLCSPRWKQS
jgi:hypothetical protein